MGGASSEVTPATTDLLIEAAHFDPVSVARTARRHKLPSEASRRFERGVDPALPRVAADRVVALLLEHGGGTADEAVTDVDRTPPAHTITLPLDLPGRIVGVDYSADVVRATLEEIGCTVVDAPMDVADGEAPGRRDVARPRVVVTVPSWRPDLVLPVDLVEEVARLRGYDEIPSVLPTAPAGRGLTDAQRARRTVARALAAHGFVEVLSYPFVGAGGARPARHPGRRPAPSGCAAGQPDRRGPARDAHERARHAAGHRAAQRLARDDGPRPVRDRPGGPARGRRGPRRLPRDRRAALGRRAWRSCDAAVPPQPRRVAGRARRPARARRAGGAPGDGPTTPTRSRRSSGSRPSWA